MGDVTQLLAAGHDGEPRGSDELLPLVYGELRQLAARRLVDEKSHRTFTATSLVHEVYLRLSRGKWTDRGHFFAVAAEAMRRILVDNARKQQAIKRGGDLQRVDLDEFEATWSSPSDQLLALNDALEALELAHPRKAAMVKLRFFAGLSVDQTAEVLGVSRSTVQNDWTYARCWLQLQIEGEPPPGATA